MKIKRKLYTSIRKFKKSLWKVTEADGLGKPIPRFPKKVKNTGLIDLAKKEGNGFEKVMRSQMKKTNKVNKKLGYPPSIFESGIIDKKDYIKSLKESMKNV
jgi:hypothetical protein